MMLHNLVFSMIEVPIDAVPLGFRVAALTQGASVPSARFRVEQYLSRLAALGIEMKPLWSRPGAYPPPSLASRLAWLPAAVCDATIRAIAANRYDVCLLQRELVSTLITAEPLIRCPLVFDVDDAIFLGARGRYSDLIAKRAAITICGNSFLAEHYAELSRVVILPTAVDTLRFVPGITDQSSPPVIGWSGSSSGFKYLYAIEDALRIVLHTHPHAILRIVADQAPCFQSLPVDRVEFELWSPDTEVAALQNFTVGLMPLEDSLWARGKCSFKMLTYMAVGIPVIVSPVGMNNEVLALGDCGFAARNCDQWVDAVSACLKDQNIAQSMGLVGRRIIEEKFSQRVIAPLLAAILKSAAEKGAVE